MIAGTGWTAAEVLEALDLAQPQGLRDVVSVQAGVNDQFRGLPVGQYAADLAELLERAIHLAGERPRRVMVVSIPDWSVTSHAPERDRPRESAAIRAFNAACRKVAVTAGALWADVTEASRSAGSDPAMLAGDGLHPSGEMYDAWVERILPIVEEMLDPGNDPGRPGR